MEGQEEGREERLAGEEREKGKGGRDGAETAQQELLVKEWERWWEGEEMEMQRGGLLC